MGLVLGKDGKTRSVEINTFSCVSNFYSLCRVATVCPANMDGIVATLISSGQGNEFTIGASFYTGRKINNSRFY